MTREVYGSGSRQPVFNGKRRVPGLYQRMLKDGTTAFEVLARMGGKLRRHTLKAKTKTDAVNELRALQTDYARGERLVPTERVITVAELTEEWLRHLEGRAGHVDPKLRRSMRTVILYRQMLEHHVLPYLGQHPVQDLTVPHVRKLIDTLSIKQTNGKRLAPSTIAAVLRVLTGLLSYGTRTCGLKSNPARELHHDDRPSGKRVTEPRYLTTEEVGALLGAMTDTYRPIAAACAYAGLRAGEALGLRWGDIDWDAKLITVTGQLGRDRTRVPPKTASSSAPVPLLPVLERELKAHRSRQASRNLRGLFPEVLVFTTARGRPHAHRNVLRAVRIAGDTAGLNGQGREPVGLHDLRHSFVAIALASGVTLPEAAMLARHASPAVTLAIYAGVTGNAREVAVDKLTKAGFGT
jgi:integrase